MDRQIVEPVLPIVIVPLAEEQRTSTQAGLLDLEDCQLDEFLRQTGKAENTQRVYRGQLQRFAAWCKRSWNDVLPDDIADYRRALKQKGLKVSSVNHALKTLQAFYKWLQQQGKYPANQPLPTSKIKLELQESSQALSLDKKEVNTICQTLLQVNYSTSPRDRAIVSLLIQGIRPAQLCELNVGDLNDDTLSIVNSDQQNRKQVLLSDETQQYLAAYLEWRQQQGGVFAPEFESPLFLCQDSKHRGKRLGYKGLHRMVKKLGAIAQVKSITPSSLSTKIPTD